MAALGKFLRTLQGDKLSFWCPGCKCGHALTIWRKEGDVGWKWNGSVEKPTFSPSVLVTSGHYVPGWKQGDECWCTYNAKHPNDRTVYACSRCHLFVKEGVIEFLGDCTHALVGKNVPLPVFDI